MKVPLDMGGGRGHCAGQQMQLTGIIYIGKRASWGMRMVRRVSRPIWQTANKVHQPGQQEEHI